MENQIQAGELKFYLAEDGQIHIDVKLIKDTVWLNQLQIAELFDTDKSGISRHINSIFKSGELARDATVANFATVQKEGTRKIIRNIEHFNLDVILSVGYRVNSKKATRFRQWATTVLRQHLTKGYTINKSRITQNYQAFMQAITDVKSLLPDNSVVDHNSILELITLFADTWFSLDAYDKDKLVIEGSNKEQVHLTAEQLQEALTELKKTLIAKDEASDIFGLEREKGNIAGIVGNVMQSFGSKDIYPSIEEKAANLLYFIIKNHPFIDGNKRSGAYAFIWFLNHTKTLDTQRITPPALTALTLLIAESKPVDKDKMIGLVCQILEKKYHA